MKKVIFLAMCIVFMGAGAVMGETVLDTTTQTPYVGFSASGPASLSVIGDANLFDIIQADFNHTNGFLTITTNWNPGKDGSVISAVQTGYLFINSDALPGFEYAINLENGNLYQVLADQSNIVTSKAIFGPLTASGGTAQGDTYGGEYDAAGLVPVQVTGAAIGSVSVNWVIGAGGLNNTVTADLFSLLGTGPWSFVDASATCGNDVMEGDFLTGVPLPPSAFLLGSGLLGLVGLGWRRRKSNA
jgi:hypothetical protein